MLTELEFMDRPIGKIVRYAYPGMFGVDNFAVRVQPVHVHDARASRHSFSINEQGFCLHACPTTFADFGDSGTIRRRYFPEVEEIVRVVLNAQDAVAFSYAMVSSRPEVSSLPSAQGPAYMAHNDYTRDIVPTRLPEILGAERARHWACGRVVQVNVWRPIKASVEEAPLALCDGRTVDWNDLIPAEFRHRDRTSELGFLRFDPRQEWWYWPRIDPSEVL
ncbi:MAG: CmcJ/NvfI family oxidoreductase, partial [Tagaea sp.]